MRLIGHISNSDHSQRFQDFLLTQNIEAQVELDSQQRYAIWILDDDQLSVAAEMLKTFQAAPDASEFQHHAKSAQKIRDQRRKAALVRQKNHIDARTQLAGGTRLKPAPLTKMIITICVALYLIFLLVAQKNTDPTDKQLALDHAHDYFMYQSRHRQENLSQQAQQHIRPPAADPTTHIITAQSWERYIQDCLASASLPNDYFLTPFNDIRQGQIWRLISPIFIHYGFFHILFNMLWLKDLGKILEHRHSSKWLFFFILFTAIISNTAQYLSGFDSQMKVIIPQPFGGMSGVVYGLFGYCMILSKYRPKMGIHVPSQLSMMMIFWLFLCLTGLIGNIANTAHFAGIITGALIGYLPVVLKKQTNRH